MNLRPFLMFFSLLNLLPSCNHLFIMQVLSEGEQHTLASTPAHPAGLYGKRGFFFQDHFIFSICITVYTV